MPGGHLPLLIEVKVAQLCLILCHSMDYTVHGILQARILEWVAFPFSRDPLNPGVKPRCPALQAGYLPADPPGKPNKTGVGTFPFSRALPNSRIELGSPALWADSLPTELSGKPICSLENVYSVLLPILKIVLFGVFLILSFIHCLYMVDIKPLLGSSFANIFSHSVHCLLILLAVSFLQLLLTLIRSIFFFFLLLLPLL